MDGELSASRVLRELLLVWDLTMVSVKVVMGLTLVLVLALAFAVVVGSIDSGWQFEGFTGDIWICCSRDALGFDIGISVGNDGSHGFDIGIGIGIDRCCGGIDSRSQIRSLWLSP